VGKCIFQRLAAHQSGGLASLSHSFEHEVVNKADKAWSHGHGSPRPNSKEAEPQTYLEGEGHRVVPASPLGKQGIPDFLNHFKEVQSGKKGVRGEVPGSFPGNQGIPSFTQKGKLSRWEGEGQLLPKSKRNRYSKVSPCPEALEGLSLFPGKGKRVAITPQVIFPGFQEGSSVSHHGLVRCSKFRHFRA
jgi:hypothetical protein